MKTAEEWSIEIGTLRGQDGVSSIIIQKIQLDAMREGMRRAAIRNNPKDWPDKPEQCAVESCNKAILTAAEELTIS